MKGQVTDAVFFSHVSSVLVFSLIKVEMYFLTSGPKPPLFTLFVVVSCLIPSYSIEDYSQSHRVALQSKDVQVLIVPLVKI